MIRVEVEEYCHSCLDFSPSVTPPHRERCDGGDGQRMTDTIIECKNRRRCANIKRYLEQQTKGD